MVLLPKSGIAQDLWRGKYFSSDLIVLKLASANYVSKILVIEYSEQDSSFDLCTPLFFVRVHIYALNMKGAIK